MTRGSFYPGGHSTLRHGVWTTNLKNTVDTYCRYSATNHLLFKPPLVVVVEHNPKGDLRSGATLDLTFDDLYL